MAADDSVLDPVARVAEEFATRYRRGERPSITEYTRQYPDLAERLRQVLPLIGLIEEAGAAASGSDSRTASRLPSGPAGLEQLGGYRILREIGSGGMGVVYEAEQVALGRHVALKVLPLHRAQGGSGLERFRREAKAAARLHHSNIVPVYEVGEASGVCYYAMQFIHGQPLDEVVNELRWLRSTRRGNTPSGAWASRESTVVGSLEGSFAPPSRTMVAAALLAGSAERLSFDLSSVPGAELVESRKGVSASFADSAPDSPSGPSATGVVLPGGMATTGVETSRGPYYRSVARIGIQVAEALEYAHREGVLHRDIKPSNLLLDGDGRVWVTDFGLAKTDGETLTQEGDIVGTIPYMAPERFRGWSDPRSDVYSLGLTLYEMLTLRPAFSSQDRIELIHQVTHEEPAQVGKLEPQAPRDLATIISKAIDKEPGRRYQTAGELAADLQRFVEDRPILARQTRTAERAWRWCRRNPALAGVAAALVSSLLLGLMGVTWQWQRAKDNADRAWDNEVLAREEGDRAKALLGRLQEQLWQSHFDRARVWGYSGQSGQRVKCLEAITEAARIRTAPALRDLAIASLALTDIRLGKEVVRLADERSNVAFDPRLESYAYVNAAKGISICRVADNGEILSLKGLEPGALLRFSPDGKRLAAGYYAAGRFQVWDLPYRKEVLNRPGQLENMEFTPNSRQLVVLESNGAINVHDLTNGAQRYLGKCPEGSWLAVSPPPHDNRLAVVSNKRLIVQVRDLATGAVLCEWSHPAREIYEVVWHPHDADLLATAGWGIFLWDARTGRQRAALPGQLGPTTNITFSHRGDILASKGWGSDTTLRLWDPWTGRQLVQITGTVSSAETLIQFSPDDRLLAFARDGRQIGLWEVEIARECRSLAGHAKTNEGHYGALDISPDGRVLAVASRGSTFHGVSSKPNGIHFWDFGSGREIHFLPIGECYDVCFHPRGDGLFTTQKEAGLQFWPIRVEPNSFIWHIGPPQSLGLSGQAAFLSLSQDGRSLAVTHLSGGSVALLTLPDSARTSLVSALPRGALGQKLWSWIAGLHRTLTISDPNLSRAVLSPDGRWLATKGDSSREIEIWTATQELSLWGTRISKPVKSLPSPEGRTQLEFSPDNRWLTASSASEYCIYDVQSWQLRHRVPRDLGGDLPGPLAFRPDGKVLALAPSGFTVRLIDPATGFVFANMDTPERDRGIPRILRFSPDGGQLVSCMDELRMIHVWDLRLIGRRLSDLGLPWELPAFVTERPEAPDGPHKPVRIALELGEFAGREHRNRCRGHLKAKEWHPAIGEANKAIALFPDDAEAHSLRGEAYYYVQDYQRAQDNLDRALKLDPDLVEAYHIRGHLHEQLGRWPKAIADFSAASARQPANAHFRAMRGRNYLHQGEYARAVDDMHKALELKPQRTDEAVASEALAWIYVGGPAPLRDPTKALPLAERAVQLLPCNYNCLNTLGIAHYRLGQYGKAVETLTRAAAVKKDGPTATNRFVLAMSYHRLGQKAEARRCYEEGLTWWKSQTGLREVQVAPMQTLRAEADALFKEK